MKKSVSQKILATGVGTAEKLCSVLCWEAEAVAHVQMKVSWLSTAGLGFYLTLDFV